MRRDRRRSAALWIYVDDADALFNRALAADGQVVSGPIGSMADQFWGDRCGMLTDPHGYSRTIATHKEDLTGEEIQKQQEACMNSSRRSRLTVNRRTYSACAQ